MAVVEFPPALRGMILEGRTREVKPSFIQASPASGPPYIQSLTDDAPTTYSFLLRFSTSDALLFWGWLNAESGCNKGRNQFTMPVRVDGGYFVDQVCQFTADGMPQQTSDSGGAITYSCKVVIRSFDAGVTADWIYQLYQVYGTEYYADVIDNAVNNLLP